MSADMQPPEEFPEKTQEQEIEKIQDEEINFLVEDDTGEIMATSKPKVVTVRVAIDSGAVRDTVSPD